MVGVQPGEIAANIVTPIRSRSGRHYNRQHLPGLIPALRCPPHPESDAPASKSGCARPATRRQITNADAHARSSSTRYTALLTRIAQPGGIIKQRSIAEAKVATITLIILLAVIAYGLF